jgi:hypothetical protein
VIEARGRNLVHQTVALPDLLSLETVRHDEPAVRIVLLTSPWGQGGLIVASDATREHAIEGSVVLDRSTCVARIRATGLPALAPGSQARVLLPGPTAGDMKEIPIPRHAMAEGSIDHTSNPRPTSSSATDETPLRAILAVDVDDVPLAIETGDIELGERSRASIFQELELEIR